jgi:ribosomal-protein-alanine N-acetyltransferase
MNAPMIETARLRLQPLTRADDQALHRLFTHPDVRRYLLEDEVVLPAWTASEIDRSMESFAKAGYGLWGLRRHGAPALLGFCGYRRFPDPHDVQLLYGLYPAYWSQGLATEAVCAVVRYGFEQLGLPGVAAAADVQNAASARVLEKAGLRPAARSPAGQERALRFFTLSRAGFFAHAPG